jgi:hypothetical protein
MTAPGVTGCVKLLTRLLSNRCRASEELESALRDPEFPGHQRSRWRWTEATALSATLAAQSSVMTSSTETDGWRALSGYDEIRFEHGVAVEVRLHVACADVGVGGH